MAYNVGVNNMFSQLMDDGDVPAQAAPKKEKKDKPKPKKTEDKSKGSTNKGRRDASKEGGRRERGGRGGRGGRRGGRGGRGGRRGGRGGYGGGGRGPKREFDRHSGTGRDRSQKKEGSGKFAAGTWRDDPKETREDAPKKEEDETEATKGEKAQVEDAEPEPEDNFVTYEEHLKIKEANRLKADVERKTRQAQNDEDQWKACTEGAAAEVDEDDFASLVISKKPKRKNKKKKAQKLSFDQFSGGNGGGRQDRGDRGDRGDRSARRGRGGERGRGRGRGRGGSRNGGRGGPRSGRDNRDSRPRGRGGRNMNLSDQSAFPTLG